MKINPIRIVVFLLLFISIGFCEQPQTKTDESNLTKTQKALMAQNQQLKEIIDSLRDNNITKTLSDEVIIRKEIVTLQNRININRRENNTLAIERDELKIISLKEKLLYEKTLKSIIKAKRQYRSKEYIKNILTSTIKTIDKTPIDKYSPTFKKEKDTDSPTANEFKQNYRELFNQKYDYLYILRNLSQNISKFRPPNFLADEANLKNITNKINSVKQISPVSALMNTYLGFTIGELMVVVAVLVIFWLLELVLVPFVSIIITNIFIRRKKDDASKSKATMKRSIKSPLKYMLRFIAVSISLVLVIQNEKTMNSVNPWLDTIFMALLAWLVYRILDNIIDIYASNILKKYPNIRNEMIIFVLKIVKIILILLVGMFLLTQLGMDIKAIIASLGVGGIAIALAAKNTLENFFASITIMVDNSFSQGDWIKTSDVEGYVVDIRMRSTRIRTSENGLITIPNSSLANKYVLNWSKRAIGRRIKMSIGITYETDMENIKQLKDDIREMLSKHPGIATEKNSEIKLKSKKMFEATKRDDLHGIKKAIHVYIDEYSPSSIDILVYCYTKKHDMQSWLTVKEDVILKISELAKKNNCEFAYPTNTLWLKK